jgi:hypothetical protein
MKLKSLTQYQERKKLSHPTIPNTSDWKLASDTLVEMRKVPSLFNGEELASLAKTIQYLKRHMTGETI